MSRKNRQQRRQQQRNARNQTKQKVHQRIQTSLAEWKRFERFKDLLPNLEEAIADLQEGWTKFAEWLCEQGACIGVDLEDMNDNILRVVGIMKSTEHLRSRKMKQYDSSANYGCHGPKIKNKFANMIAEIVIEDISDGKL